MAADLHLQAAAVTTVILQINSEPQQGVFVAPVRPLGLAAIDIVAVKVAAAAAELIGAFAEIDQRFRRQEAARDLQNALIEKNSAQVDFAQQIALPGLHAHIPVERVLKLPFRAVNLDLALDLPAHVVDLFGRKDLANNHKAVARETVRPGSRCCRSHRFPGVAMLHCRLVLEFD